MRIDLSSFFVVLAGAWMLWAGAEIARSRFRFAMRASRFLATGDQEAAQAWAEWFRSGFSGIALGRKWLTTAVFFGVWTGAGLWLLASGLIGCVRH